MRDFNGGKGKEGEKMRDILINYMFGSKEEREGEKRDLN